MTAAIHPAHLQEVDMHSLATIQVETAKAFNIPLADLRRHRRTRQFVMPRIVAMALAREMTGMSQQQVGRYFTAITRRSCTPNGGQKSSSD